MKGSLPNAARGGDHRKSSAWFSRAANLTASWTGTPSAFVIAAGTIIIWGVTGPIFHFSDTWQRVINTGTTIITFLMVFLIQNTQNRDTKALQIKLAELITALKDADNKIAYIEDADDDELAAAHQIIKDRAEQK